MASDARISGERGASCLDGAANGPLLADLARRYSAALSRYFERRVSLKSDIPDLVQDVFVRLARLSDLSQIEKPEHYIFTTAASALRDKGRRDVAHHRRDHGELHEDLHQSSEISAERVLAGKQAMARLQVALRDLPERTRDVFVLRVFEEVKLKDIASTMGISQRAVEKHYAKALALVAAVLRDEHHG
jgi:RNA polymerase sigma factor (sigma-70 family)